MFKKKLKLSSFCIAASLMIALAFAPASWAQTPCATTYTLGNTSGGTSTTVAVAANFAAKLTYWITNYFFNSTMNPYYNTAYADYKVVVCADSTGNIENYIGSGSLTPSVFFAADSSVRAYSGKTSVLYAKGIPILMGYTSSQPGKSKYVTDISDLISGLSGSSYTVTGGVSTTQSMTVSSTLTTGSANVLLADPDLAPYGQAAANILNNMLPIYGSYSIPDSPPGWVKTPITGTGAYSTITTAFNAIGVDTKAGFAAFAQIADLDKTNIKYVKFTNNTDEEFFETHQWVVHYSSNTVGDAIWTLFYSETPYATPSSTTWNTYITTNGAYDAIP